MKYTVVLICLLSCVVVRAADFAQVDSPWLRAGPPGAQMLAAYLNLHNTETRTLTLIGAYSPDFRMSEIHRTVEVDGVFKMRHQPELTVAPNQRLVFEPGGLHIMLMQPLKAIQPGAQVKICLLYRGEDGQTQVQHLWFPVKKGF